MQEKLDKLEKEAAFIALEIYNIREREKSLVQKLNQIGAAINALNDVKNDNKQP